MNKSPITFSIDDGHPLDLKTADILEARGIPGIFYISIRNSTGRPVLTRREIRSLSKRFGIGAHTYNHTDLTAVPPETAAQEMKNGKEELEDIIGRKVTSFAWPWGRFTPALCRTALGLGFEDVRGVSLIDFHPQKKHSGLWFPNCHLTRIGFMRELRHLLRKGDFYSLAVRLKHLGLPHEKLATLYRNMPGRFHFWTHSWEIDELNLWDTLASL